MCNYNTLSKEELISIKNDLLDKYNNVLNNKVSLDMSRGKPCKEQLDLSNELLTISEYTSKDGVDTRNYGILDGLIEAKTLFSNLLDIPKDNILIGGNSTLNMIYDCISRLYIFGDGENEAWHKLPKIKFLCPVPGYDRHFDILEKFNIEMINIPLIADGPNMDIVEELCQNDDTIKGMICVPVHSNPTGSIYGEKTIERLAKLSPKAKDFKVFLDNAYALHNIYEAPKTPSIFNIFQKYGSLDSLLYFFSTSKMTFAGSGISILAGSDKALNYTKKHLSIQTISYDKINQLRTVLFLKDKENTFNHMKKHAQILKPKFDVVLNTLDENFKNNPVLKWEKPLGGYFISVDTEQGLAKKIVNMCSDAGVVLTPAGSTYPKKLDKNDTNIRIAPSFPSIDELKNAIDIFCLCVKIATVEKSLQAMV